MALAAQGLDDWVTPGAQKKPVEVDDWIPAPPPEINTPLDRVVKAGIAGYRQGRDRAEPFLTRYAQGALDTARQGGGVTGIMAGAASTAADVLSSALARGQGAVNALQAGVAQTGSELVSPQFGRDLASIPEAFAGMPGAFRTPEGPPATRPTPRTEPGFERPAESRTSALVRASEIDDWVTNQPAVAMPALPAPRIAEKSEPAPSNVREPLALPAPSPGPESIRTNAGPWLEANKSGDRSSPVAVPEKPPDSAPVVEPVKTTRPKREPVPFVPQPKEPMRLVQFLRNDFTVGRQGDINSQTMHGGLRDTGGDLAAIVGGTKRLPALRGGRGFRGLINNQTGSNLDDATLRAWQAGYFPEHSERPAINDLLNKIDEDLNRDNPAYSHHDQSDIEAYQDAISRNSEIDRLASQHSLPTRGLTHDQFFDALADKLSLDEMADEHARLEPEHADAYKEFEEAAKEWVAYHASPHEFNQFDISKIGTGEGAQAYGHGLYFAESTGVHKSYLDAFGYERATDAVDNFLRKNRGVNLTPLEITEALKKTPAGPLANDPQVVGAIQKLLPNYLPNAAVMGEDLKNYRVINDAAEKAIRGVSYQVRIKPKPDEMLDWDKPLSEQSPEVKAALDRLPEGLKERLDEHAGNHGRNSPLESPEDSTGGDFINSASHYNVVDAPEELSEELSKVGIKGIRYHDANSRRLQPTLDGKPWDDPTPSANPDFKRAEDLAMRAVDRAGSVQKGLEELKKSKYRPLVYQQAAAWLEKNRARVKMEPHPDATHNVVVFDHNDVQITHRNGEPVKPKDWNPDEFHGNDQSRSLEDLENEWREENAALAAQQRPGGGSQSGPTASHSRAGQESGGSVGDPAASSGRANQESGADAGPDDWVTH